MRVLGAAGGLYAATGHTLTQPIVWFILEGYLRTLSNRLRGMSFNGNARHPDPSRNGPRF